MTYLSWSEKYSIGVEMFDDEHKTLMAILNELHDAAAAGEPQATLQQICYRLMEHAIRHFRHEEMYFDDWAYPDREAHKEAHKRLRREIFALQERLLAEPDAKGALNEFLREWLTQHILHDDKTYGAFLRQRGLQ